MSLSEKVEQITHKIVDTLSGAGEKITQKLEAASTSDPGTMTRFTGCPVAHFKNSMTAGPTGPLVSADPVLLEQLLHFNREKVPARNVHALGCGCYGTFTVTNDITKYTRADLFSTIGKKTEVFTRFSGIFTEQGDADTQRDPRGFAIKFYTKEGNWDLLGINTPVFAVRDAKQGPGAVHAFKRDCRTGAWNPTQTWDYVATHPEGLHQVAMLYTDRTGTPSSYRLMNAYGCHTFSLVNANKERFWVKFHIKSLQGARGFNLNEAKIIAGEDPNFLSRDLYQAIEMKNYPRWKMYIQIMPEAEGYKYPWTFDCTKVWKKADYPLIEVGILEMNKNPTDYFCEVEQVAFSPANVVPGIGLSPDKLLQGRLLIYDDTQTHRIGPNYKQLYVNRPHAAPVNDNLQLGGHMHIDIKNRFPHYYPSMLGATPHPDPSYLEPGFRCDGPADFYNFPNEGTYEDCYAQVADFWRILSPDQRENLCENLAASLEKVTDPQIIIKMVGEFRKCNQLWGDTVYNKIQARMSGKKPANEQFCSTIAKQLLEIKPTSIA